MSNEETSLIDASNTLFTPILPGLDVTVLVQVVTIKWWIIQKLHAVFTNSFIMNSYSVSYPIRWNYCRQNSYIDKFCFRLLCMNNEDCVHHTTKFISESNRSAIFYWHFIVLQSKNSQRDGKLIEQFESNRQIGQL